MGARVRPWLHVTWIGTVLLGLGALSFVPTPPWDNIYCPVDADARFWVEVPEAQCLRTSSWLGNEDHLVREDRLFLRVQSTCHALLLVTYVDAPRWNGVGVANYRAAHPELEKLWPNPGLADGGVRWLRH
jgi:hypothetical protein